GLHRAWSGVREPEVALPLREDSVRRPPRHAAVDDGGPADALSLGEDDRRPAEDHRRGRVAVESADHRRWIGRERLRPVEPALLEDEDIETGVAQPGGR